MWNRPERMETVTRLLFTAAVVALGYAALMLAIRLPLFALREIRLSGDMQHLTREQVQFLVRREVRGNFFTLDVERTRKAFEKLPWVRKVTVRRQWPDRLEVALEEHVALARWGNVSLVNTHGELFQAASGEALPSFAGPTDAVKEITQQYGQFKKLLEPLKVTPATVMLSPRRAWSLRLTNGLAVELGRERMEERLTRFVAVYGSTVGQAALPAYVDLRYPNGFAANYGERAPRPGGAKAKQG